MKRAKPLLGTIVEIHAEGADRMVLENGIANAFEAIEMVHELMSFHAPDSDLSRLNRQASQQPVKVHRWTYSVLRSALKLHALTDGAFDCAVAPQLIRWGLLPEQQTNGPTLPGHDASLTSASIELLSNYHVRFHRPVIVDLGGIAKGFAVDKAITALKRAGVPDAMVNAGGDLRLFGPTARLIHVRDPEDPSMLRPAGWLRDGAIATSAAYFSRREVDNQSVSALVEPRSRNPIVSSRSFSVIAATCVVADGLTKALAVHANPRAPYLRKMKAKGLVL